MFNDHKVKRFFLINHYLCQRNYSANDFGNNLHHPHHLMHKAVGWMLREMGKRIDMDLLRHFLEEHAHEMPRTALRYAIEKMDEGERHRWMGRTAADA